MIDSLKDLEKLLKLCRKQGVTEIDLNGIKLSFGELPHDRSERDEDVSSVLDGFPSGELTPEQLMFYSAGGIPEDDPVLKASAS